MVGYNQDMIDNRINPTGHSYHMSALGLQQLMSRPMDPRYPLKNIRWTDDYRVELPVRVEGSGVGAVRPTTLIDEFRRAASQYEQRPALSAKSEGKWHTINYREYYNRSMSFAASLLAVGLPEFSCINIIGSNAPEWLLAFMGALFARCVPTGIYTTNSPEVCAYIAKNSECRLVVAENMEYARKYVPLLEADAITMIVVYGDRDVGGGHGGRIVPWEQFLKLGEKVKAAEVEARMDRVGAGSCATIVYTSGTTGMPKGVMLSHDNLTWSKKSSDLLLALDDTPRRIVSYLPLSHAAGIYADLVSCIMSGYHLYFARPDALQGTLLSTLLEVRPQSFLSVPRVWEKIAQKMRQVANQNGWLKTKVAGWAKSIGAKGTIQQVLGQQTSLQFKIAKKLIYSKIKKQLGLDQCNIFYYGAAPLDPEIRQYFLSINIYLYNVYGMSECAGPQNFTNKRLFRGDSLNSFKEAGSKMPGTQIKILRQNARDKDGEICYKGRHIFMGYYKNPEQTNNTIDAEGFLHSGDLGTIDKNDVLYITGRVKELIITAGGQNIPPVLIENQIKLAMPFVSNAMVVGEGRKNLCCLLTLKQDPPSSGKLEILAKKFLQANGCEVQTIEDAIRHPNFRKIIVQGLQKVNNKSISRAQNVHNFYVLSQDFSIENGVLTPTMKLKRNVASKKYQKQIQSMYMIMKPKL